MSRSEVDWRSLGDRRPVAAAGTRPAAQPVLFADYQQSEGFRFGLPPAALAIDELSGRQIQRMGGRVDSHRPSAFVSNDGLDNFILAGRCFTCNDQCSIARTGEDLVTFNF